MRYYLDTQSLAQFFLSRDNTSPDVRAVFEDYSNQFLTSMVCVKELIHLIQTDRIRPLRGKKRYDATAAIDSMIRAGVNIVPTTILHLQQLSRLPLFPEHNDPNDRLIIAQAIADRVPLITTDRKFALYEDSGLQVVENR